MYKDYYRLKEYPFNITPDPRFLYLTARHREALNHLMYGIRNRKGFICLTGEVGAGKTTICRAMLRELPGTFHTALILNPMLTETQLLRAIVDEFGIETKRRDRLGYLNLINEYLLGLNAAGEEAVLIIDEAQDLSPECLELTRLLSNLETDSRKLVQICLIGQPELRDMLAEPRFRQLAQRITVRYHLANMDRQDTEGYLNHRLTVATGEPSGVRFDRGAIRAIHRFSRGTPRLINALGDKALLAGYVHRTHQISRRLVKIGLADLKEAC